MSSTSRRGLSATSGDDAIASNKRKYPPGPSSGDSASKKQKALPQDRAFYQDILLFTHKRLGLSGNAVTLPGYLDDVKLCIMDIDDLARKLRQSSALYKAIIDMINHCSSITVERPTESAECSRIIRKCTEMMEILQQPPPPGLPFFKFPREIRDRIYRLYFESQFKGKGRYISRHLTADPPCIRDYCLPRTLTFRLNLSLIQTCSRMRDEVLPTFYNIHTLSFNCTCTMWQLLSSNTLAASNVRSLKFHWRGSTADAAIPILYRCPELKNLTILVSKMTLYNSTEREARMKTFFQGNVTRMCDARGINELMCIRGLESISVRNSNESVANNVARDTVWSLQRLLETCVEEEKPEGYGK